MVATVMCIHRIKKYGCHTITKYQSFDEIHVKYIRDGELVRIRIFKETEKSESVVCFNDMCLQAQIDYTKEQFLKSKNKL